MRVLHTESSLGWGGQELRILNEAAGMIRRGHEVLVAAPEASRIFAEASSRGVPALALPIGRKRWRGLVAMRRLLGRRRFDVINSHSSTDSWLAALACIGRGAAPVLVRTRHISTPLPQNFRTRWLYGRATTHVVTTGEALRLQVMAEARLPADRVTSVPTGIDLGLFRAGDKPARRREFGIPEEVMVFGIVATLRSWKGHAFLFDAFAAIEDRSARLLVVGDGPGMDNLKRQASLLGIADRVIMAGNQRDVVPWLQAMDVFALPSYANEGVPQALMQAMAAGVPVVTTTVGSIGELVADGVTGLVVPPKDTGALRIALEKLAADAAMRSRVAIAARAHVVARCSEDGMLDRMEEVFRKATA